MDGFTKSVLKQISNAKRYYFETHGVDPNTVQMSVDTQARIVKEQGVPWTSVSRPITCWGMVVVDGPDDKIRVGYMEEV